MPNGTAPIKFRARHEVVGVGTVGDTEDPGHGGGRLWRQGGTQFHRFRVDPHRLILNIDPNPAGAGGQRTLVGQGGVAERYRKQSGMHRHTHGTMTHLCRSGGGLVGVHAGTDQGKLELARAREVGAVGRYPSLVGKARILCPSAKAERPRQRVKGQDECAMASD